MVPAVLGLVSSICYSLVCVTAETGTMPAGDSSSCVSSHYIGSDIEDLGGTLTRLALAMPASIVHAPDTT
jgi:hypothetical protein